MSRRAPGPEPYHRQAQRGEVPRRVGERLLLREVDGGPCEPHRGMESLAPFRRPDGREDDERARIRESKDNQSRKRDEDRRLQDPEAKRFRKSQSSGILEPVEREDTRDRDRQRERDRMEPHDMSSRRSRSKSAGPDDGRSPDAGPAHGPDGSRDVASGFPSREERRSRTPPPSHLEEILFNAQETKCNGVEIILNLSARDVHLDHRGKGCWVVNAKAKRGAEIQFKQLSEKEKQEFLQAKKKEVDSYIENMAVSIAHSQGGDPRRILGMRWVLVWKNITDEDGVVTGQKAKARLIVKGFEDPDLLKVPRDAPTLSVLGRNLILSICSMRNWKLSLGDIETAFLNSDPTEESREIYSDPPKDVKDMLGMNEKQLFRIRKALYGLLNVPRRWMEKLSQELRKLGWIPCALDNCVWRLFDGDRLTGVLGIHMDDVVCGGEGHVYDESIKRLQAVFPFGSWKEPNKEKVVFCGCELSQDQNGIQLKQERYALGINEINLSKERKQSLEDDASPDEKKALRGLLGSLAWRGTQTAPWILASTSILQGHQNTAKVQDLLHANKLCRLQRAHCELGLTFAREIHEPLFLTFTDASHANRADLSSQGGTLTFLTDRKVLKGHKAPFSLVAWRSRKLKRVARSSTCAEIQSCGNGVDENEFVRQMCMIRKGSIRKRRTRPWRA